MRACVLLVLIVLDVTVYLDLLLLVSMMFLSLQPNCYSKIITVDGRKKIIIFARRRYTNNVQWCPYMVLLQNCPWGGANI